MAKQTGTITNSKKVPEYGVLIESRIHNQNYDTGLHAHNCPSLIYVVSGMGTFNSRDQEFPLSANSVIALTEGIKHQLADKPRHAMTVFSLYFNPSIANLNENITKSLFAFNQPCTLPPYYAKNIRRMLRQILNEQDQKPPGYKAAIQQLLSVSLLDIYRAQLEISRRPELHLSSDSTSRVRQVLDYVSSNYFEQLTLSEAADMSHLSQRQFSNICKQISGKSFVQFVNEIRTDVAQKLLHNSEAPVSAIAFEIGYEDLSTFYRAFKKYTGRNPLDFRK